MVLISRGRLPSGMWAAWAGSQDSGHLAPTGGRLQGCVCKRQLTQIRAPFRALNGVS